MYIDIVVKDKEKKEYFCAIVGKVAAEEKEKMKEIANQFMKLSSFVRKGSKDLRYYCTMIISGIGKKPILRKTSISVPSENKEALKALNQLLDAVMLPWSGYIHSEGFPLVELQKKNPP